MRALSLSILALVPALAVPAHADSAVAPVQPLASTAGAAAAAAIDMGSPGADAPVRLDHAPLDQKPTPERAKPLISFALGVNAPWGWRSRSFGASAYVGVGQYVGVRANFARYDNSESILPVLAGGDSAPHSGRLIDTGIGVVFHTRRLCDGFSLELGLLRRDRHTRVAPEFDPVEKVDSITYAGRVLIGWTWRIAEHGFIAVAVGFSDGKETGSRRLVPELPREPTTEKLDRRQGDGEAHLRFGFVFGR